MIRTKLISWYFYLISNHSTLQYHMTEKALEQDAHVSLIIERLLGLEKIHKESPNISATFQTVKEQQHKITKDLEEERIDIDKTKKTIVKAVKQIEEALKSISTQTQ